MTDIVSTCYLLSVNNKNNGKTNKQKKNIVFFSYTKKTIYLYLFTYSAGGQDGLLLETCIQCCDCTDKRSHGQTGKLASFQLNSFSCVSSIFKR